MAESAVSYVVQKLAESLYQEVVFLKGVHDQVQWLRDELKRMQCFLKDADTKQEGDERVRNWVSDIRKVAYDAEDLIDTFILTIECQKRRGIIGRYARKPVEWIHIRDVGKEIEAIKERVGGISKSRETFGIQNLGEGTSSKAKEILQQMRRSYPRDVEKDIVGLEEDTKKLVEQLVQNDDRRYVISIVGMGGVGKTTLAKKVYNHSEVGDHFDCHAWAYVSQEYRPRDVLQRIIKELVKTPTKKLLETMEKSQEQDLENMLHEQLQGKRYLVVLDDIWSRTVWKSLSRAFSNPSNGSRLMLTTRKKSVALRADPRSIHELRILSKEDSWELFCRKTFIYGVGTKCPPELDEIGRKIVSKCACLPLAITIMGGLLSERKELRIEWERVLSDIDSHFASGRTGVSAILALSYNDLPHNLKSCFLHLGHFPEDYVITTRTLFHLWVAEGLIPQGKRRMEDEAELYLNKLINRNMVQAVRKSASERVKECRIHDLLRDLSISKAKEEICLDIFHGNIDLPRSDETRHQAVYSGVKRYFDSRPSTPHLRSLIFFPPSERHDKRITADFICESFKLLRVLDLGGESVNYLPSEIGKLIHLRYLGLQRTYIEELPSSMRYLRSLQTLDISSPLILKIPDVICKMENLRHLYMNGNKDAQVSKIDSLKHLQTLSGINSFNWKENDSTKLINLRKLGIIVRSGIIVSNGIVLRSDLDDDEFFISVAQLKSLSSLKLSVDEEVEFLPSLNGLSHLHGLTKLYLSGMMRKLAIPHEFPPNLNQLTLETSDLQQNAMEVLGKLPKLSILKLRENSYRGHTLAFSANQFLQLNFLELHWLPNLRELKVEEGALPRLRRLRISFCESLTFLPQHRWMKFLSALEELEIDERPQEIPITPIYI